MPKGLDVNITNKDPQSLSVEIIGRVDGETSPVFEQIMEPEVAKHPKKVAVDMAKCDYVSSAGMRVFFDLKKKVNEAQGNVSFFNLQPQIKKVFEIVKALPLECIFSDEAEADAYLERMMDEALKKKSE